MWPKLDIDLTSAGAAAQAAGPVEGVCYVLVKGKIGFLPAGAGFCSLSAVGVVNVKATLGATGFA